MEGNQTSLIKSGDSDIEKLIASAVPESTKKSPKYAVNVFEGKNVWFPSKKVAFIIRDKVFKPQTKL